MCFYPFPFFWSIYRPCKTRAVRISDHKGRHTTTQRQLEYETCVSCHAPVRSAILKQSHHPIVEGKVTSDQIVGMTTATSVEGSPIAISVKDGTVYLNDSAKVVTADVMASNGVIHIIDAVILPPEM